LRGERGGYEEALRETERAFLDDDGEVRWREMRPEVLDTLKR
jgi:hypothetical protein